MRTPDDAAEWARGQWRRNWKTWLTAGDPGVKTWPLHPPTEAQLAADPDAVARWVASWRRLRVPGLTVEWAERRSLPCILDYELKPSWGRVCPQKTAKTCP